ncbi:MAG TPA: hypothetical protein VHF90_10665 [Thermoleophilaceae bacterium]|nr:hypothetical protein [Thermoleophilaceae bacterium]
MLFDLQGKRRRVVQATYLTLAVLMGGGLVLFGIGGEVSGGLLDAFSDRSGGSGNDVVEERIDRNEERVQSNPRAEAPHKELVRDYYALAVGQATDQGVFPADAQDELRKASTHWNTYLEVEKGKPDASLARVALQVYDQTALNQPQQAVKVARIIAEEGNDAASYMQLAQYALLAGDKRIEKLASAKAVDLAPRNQRKAVREQLQQIKGAIIAQQLQESGDLNIQPGQGQGGGAQQQGGGQGQGAPNQGGQ